MDTLRPVGTFLYIPMYVCRTLCKNKFYKEVLSCPGLTSFAGTLFTFSIETTTLFFHTWYIKGAQTLTMPRFAQSQPMTTLSLSLHSLLYILWHTHCLNLKNNFRQIFKIQLVQIVSPNSEFIAFVSLSICIPGFFSQLFGYHFNNAKVLWLMDSWENTTIFPTMYILPSNCLISKSTEVQKTYYVQKYKFPSFKSNLIQVS